MRFLIFITLTFLPPAVFAGGAGLPPLAEQSLSAMDCGDRLVSIAEPRSVADTWLHRWILRMQHAMPETSPTLDFKTVYSSPAPNDGRIEALKAAAHAVWKQENRLDDKMRAAHTTRDRYDEYKDRQGRLQLERYRVISRYFSAQGAGNTLIAQEGHSPRVLILPGGRYSLAAEVNGLYNLHGTLVVACDELISRYAVEENILYLPWRVALQGEFGSREKQLAARIKQHLISEIEIADSTSPELNAFLFNPENAVPQSLRFLTYAQDSAPGKQDGYRFSFRTGTLGTLPSEVREPLEQMVRLHQASGHGVLAVGMRKAGGQWMVSFPEEFPLSARKYSFQNGFDAVSQHMGPRLSSRETGLPDVFLFVAGRPQFSALDMEDLKSFTAIQDVGINSLSYVLLNQSAQGPLYYIHTVDAVHAADTTVFADQLRMHFDRGLARQAYSRLGVIYDPFAIRP